MHRLFQSLLIGAQRAPLDLREEDFWDAVRKCNTTFPENLAQDRVTKTQVEVKGKVKPSPSPQRLYTQQCKKSHGEIADTASDPNRASRDEEIKAPSVAAPYGMPVNLAISDALLSPPPSFPSLRIGT